MLDPTRVTLDEYVNQNWTVTVEAGTTIEDILKPEFFSNISSKMRPYDHMRVRTDAGEWYGEFLVLSCGRVWAKLAPIFTMDLTSKDIELTQAGVADGMEQYEVAFRGPHLKFCIIRKSDRESIKEQLQTKAEAQAWLASYVITT
jgi:hypothetical protein